MKNTLIKALSILSILVFSSCATGMQIAKENFKPINTNFEGVFQNKQYNLIKEDEYTKTLASLLSLKDKPKEIALHFNTKKELVVRYKDSLNNPKEKILKGKLRNRGYYQVYLYKKRLEIPPLFPIIYSKVSITKIRIAMTKEDKLVIDYISDDGMNIFILAGGTYYRNQYYFEKN